MHHPEENDPDRPARAELDLSAGDRRRRFLAQIKGSCADQQWSTEDLFAERRREAGLEAIKELRFR